MTAQDKPSAVVADRAEALAKALEGLMQGNEFFSIGGEEAHWHRKMVPRNESLTNARAALEAYRSQPSGWRPISEIPARGQFLVYMPEEERTPIQVARWRENVKVIGGLFSFDCKPVTHFMELPTPPSNITGEQA